MKRIIVLIIVGIASLNVPAQIPVVDALNALIETVENLGQVGEIVQKQNANSTEKKGVQNGRRILLKMQKFNNLRRKINPILQNSGLNNIDDMLKISNSLSTDMRDYLDLQGVDDIGIFDTDLANMEVVDWFENLDYDIISKLSTENTFEENWQLLDANYKKKLQIEKLAAKFTLQAAISNYDLADYYELKAVELDNLLNGESFKVHTLEGMNVTLMDMIPDIMTLLPGGLEEESCTDFQIWADSLVIINEGLESLKISKETAINNEDMGEYETLVFEELLLTAELENYQNKINMCSSGKGQMKVKIKEQANFIQGVFDELGAAMEDLGLFDALEEIEIEPDLNLSDGERVKLFNDRDVYFQKAKELRNKATQMIYQANQSSVISNQELQLKSMQQFTKSLTELK